MTQDQNTPTGGFNPDIHVPGMWRCAKCAFVLVQSSLNAADGTVTARDTPGDKCPNCDVPLWRLTWREHAAELAERLEHEITERRATIPPPSLEGAGERGTAVAMLEVALADLVQLCDHATFDNGVRSPDGRSEADYWAGGALDHARNLLKMSAEHQAFPDPASALASRLKYRLEVLLERSGTEEQAIVSRGIGIGYLFARELYKALAGMRSEIERLPEAAREMLADHMTSDRHHPGYVLVPVAAFEKMRDVLSTTPAPVDEAGKGQKPDAV